MKSSLNIYLFLMIMVLPEILISPHKTVTGGTRNVIKRNYLSGSKYLTVPMSDSVAKGKSMHNLHEENINATGDIVDQVLFTRISGVPYAIYSYKTVGTSSFTSPLGVTSIDYLIVGGGGGGGGNTGGGGGAGGFLKDTTGYTITADSSYTVDVGGGGTGGHGNSVAATNGGNSVFGVDTAFGGGSGASNGINAGNGGSGGGGSATNSNGNGKGTSGGTGVSGQGNSGGVGTPSNNNGKNSYPGEAGGGGGASAAGTNSTTSAPGNGGDGLQTSISGSSQYYAGGGGGGSGNTTLGTGGLGGGADGEITTDTTSFTGNGVANTGGGGGGGIFSTTITPIGGNGGSGIVIIRFPLSEVSNYSAILSGTVGYILFEDDTVNLEVASGSTLIIQDSIIVRHSAQLEISSQADMDTILETNSFPVKIEDTSALVIDSAVQLNMSALKASIALSDSGKIILKSGSSYLDSISANPLLEVRQHIFGAKGWRMVSSPLAVKFSGLFKNRVIAQGFSGTTYPALQPNVLWWKEDTTGTLLEHWRSPDSLNESITPGRGYLYYNFNGDTMPNSTTVYYSDSLPDTLSATGYENTMTGGSFSYSLTFTPVDTTLSATDTSYFDVNIADEGWNLIGNPTASTLDWDASGWTKTNVSNTIYIWDPSANSNNGAYLYWDGYTGTLSNGLIAPYQGFWVKADTANPALSFTNQAKTITPGTWYKSTEAKNPAVIIPITATSDNLKAESFISFTNTGKIGPDRWDAYQLTPLSDNWVSVYTNSSPSYKQPLVINNLPPDSNEVMNIPLNVTEQIANGLSQYSCVLKWKIPENWPDNLNITLMDHQLQKAISMQNDSSYEFNVTNQTSGKATARTQFIPLPRVPVMVENSNHLKSGETSRFTIVISPMSQPIDTAYQALHPTLLNPFPNPFTGQVTLAFRLPERAKVQIEVYALDGKLIDTPVNGEYPAGVNKCIWNTKDIYSGICIFKMISGKTVQVKKGIILR